MPCSCGSSSCSECMGGYTPVRRDDVASSPGYIAQLERINAGLERDNADLQAKNEAAARLAVRYAEALQAIADGPKTDSTGAIAMVMKDIARTALSEQSARFTSEEKR